MVSGTKFYIYGGGRWREVDVNDGRVEGWGKASFVYPKRGKVQVAKTRAVLSGLRDLATGQSSTVKDGAHLPYKKIEVPKRNERNQETACDHSRCCQHTNNNGCDPSKKDLTKVNEKVQCKVKIDAGIQTSLPSQTLTFPDSFNNQISRKRHRDTSSSDENISTRMTTTAMVHTNSPKKVPKLALHRKLPTINSPEKNNRSNTQKIPSLKLNKTDSSKYNIYQRKRTNSSDSIVWVVLPKERVIKEKHHSRRKSKKATKKRRHDGLISSPKLKPQHNVKTSEHMTLESPKKRQVREASEITLDDEDAPLSKPKLRPQTGSDVKRAVMRQDQCKELTIDEKDVELLRNYLLHNASDFDLLKFDQDDEYKKLFFFRINPLVNVERCQKIAWMLRRDSQDGISLKDFASQLGLRSISEQSSMPRYRMRKSKEAKHHVVEDDSYSETDNERSEKYVKQQNNSAVKAHRRKSDGNVKSTTNASRSSSSETDTEHSEEYHHVIRRRSGRVQTKGQDVELSSKRYVTRQSGVNSNRKDPIEILSKNKRRASDDSSEAEFSTSNKQNRRRQNTVNKGNNLNLDLTKTTDDESDVKLPKEITRKGKNRIQNINNLTNDENSDVELFQSSQNVNGKLKIKSDAIKIKNKSVEENTSKEVPKQLKEHNGKVNVKDNKIGAHNGKYSALRNSSEESSDFDEPKLRQSIRRVQDKVNTNQKSRHSVKDKESDDDNSDIAPHKSLKEPHRRVLDMDNVNKLNGNIRKYQSNTEETSDEEIPETLKKTNTELQNNRDKDSTNPHRNGEQSRRNNVDSGSNFKSSKDSLRRPQNRPNDKNKSIEDNTNSDGNTHKSTAKPSESNRKVGHKRNAPEATKVVEMDPNKNNSKNTSANILSSENENDTVEKRKDFSKPVINEAKSLVGSKRQVLKRPPVGFREYSMLEDQAIVAWISVGGRASCVNGNRIWQELQEGYERITGQTRSWHSLRNRYLRYILPKLGMLALPHSQESRLRAAAATGEIKSRKRQQRRNSIFGAPSRGALSRLPGTSRSLSSEPEPPPKRHKYDYRKLASSSPKRILRSSLPSSSSKPTASSIKSHSSPSKSRRSRSNSHTSPSKPRRSPSKSQRSPSKSRRSPSKSRRSRSKSQRSRSKSRRSPSKSRRSPSKSRPSPRYSDITRRFANTHRKDESTPSQKSASSKKSIENKATLVSKELKALKSTSEERPGLRNSVNSSRRSLRDLEPQKSPEKEQSRTRKLFNPSAML